MNKHFFHFLINLVGVKLLATFLATLCWIASALLVYGAYKSARGLISERFTMARGAVPSWQLISLLLLLLLLLLAQHSFLHISTMFSTKGRSIVVSTAWSTTRSSVMNTFSRTVCCGRSRFGWNLLLSGSICFLLWFNFSRRAWNTAGIISRRWCHWWDGTALIRSVLLTTWTIYVIVNRYLTMRSNLFFVK